MKRKLFKKIGMLSLALAATGSTAAITVACAVKGQPGVFRYFYNTDVLKDNNSPLNPSFNNSPISTYAQSVNYNLVTYETVDGKSSGDGTKSFESNLMLEAANQLEVFKTEDQMKMYDSAMQTKNTEMVETNKPYIFNSVTALKKQTDYDKAISEGQIYRFKIATNNWWVDSEGNKKQQVSSKDFERGIESYALAAGIGYNRNGYFLSLMGLDTDKTVGYQENGKNVSVTSKEYNVENYVSTKDDTFTVYLKAPYPYTLDLLSKEYFGAIPHTNYKVKNISMASGNIGLTDRGSIDTNNTNFNNLYGSGDINNFTRDVWFAGPYYLSHFTATQIIFQLNPIYNDVNRNKFSNQNEKKIQTIVETYGSGTVDTYYELFKSGQNDFLPSVPSTKKSDAVRLFTNDGLNLFRNSKIPQSNYIVYTPRPYVIGNSITTNQNVSPQVANFINDWSSKNSTIVRAAIAGLINHFNLSKINLPSSGDFQLSSVPFGNFEGYYQEVAKENSKFFGGLPRPYSDYTSDGDYELSEFEMPIYDYKDNGITIEKVKINRQSLQEALKSMGFEAVDGKRLVLSTKFGEGSFTVNYTNYLNQLKLIISDISGGLMDFVVNGRNGANPSAIEWFSQQSSPLGFSYWSPDYNGVGTWLEASALLGNVEYNSKTYEGNPESNAHNSWNTYFQAIVKAIKMTGATWTPNSSGNGMNGEIGSGSYVIQNGNMNKSDPFADDNKIQGAFNQETLKSFGITLENSPQGFYVVNESNKVTASDSPGMIFGKIGVEFANYLIKMGVFDQTKLDQYVNDPSKLNTKTNPKQPSDIILGSDVIKKDQSSQFTKYLGVFSGQSEIQALWTTTVNDSDYSYIPRSESGLNELTFALVNPYYNVRVSSVGSINFRDWSQN